MTPKLMEIAPWPGLCRTVVVAGGEAEVDAGRVARQVAAGRLHVAPVAGGIGVQPQRGADGEPVGRAGPETRSTCTLAPPHRRFSNSSDGAR